MSIEKDQKYLRVRNTSDQDLYLADLDDEENKEENRGVQVYISSGEYADLPLDDDVLHSYEQGTIRGFIDQGLVAASPYGEQQENILWVAPDGDDSDPGTYSSPLASIQTAVDRLESNLGIDRDKVVKVKQGRYQENLIINTCNLTIEGTHPFGEVAQENPLVDSRRGIELYPEDDSRPVITITNMTKSEVETFESDGGVSYTFNAPDTFSYDGVSLDNRETRDDLVSDGVSDLYMDIVLRGLTIHSDNTEADPKSLLCLTVPDENHDNLKMTDIRFESVYGFNLDGGKSNIYVKNIKNISLNGCSFYQGDTVFDTNRHVWLTNNITRKTTRNGTPYGYYRTNLVFHGDTSVSSTDGGVGLGMNVALERMYGATNLYFIGALSRTNSGTTQDPNAYPWRTGMDGTLGLAPSENILDRRRVNVECFEFDGRGAAVQSIDRLYCHHGSYSGSGTLDVNELISHQGNFDITGGSNHTIRGGHVNGDLTINGGTDVTLKGVTVDGDVIVDQDNTSATLEGCHVEGTLDVDSGNDNSGVSVTVSGGTVMNTNDPGSNITTETPAIG